MSQLLPHNNLKTYNAQTERAVHSPHYYLTAKKKVASEKQAWVNITQHLFCRLATTPDYLIYQLFSNSLNPYSNLVYAPSDLKHSHYKLIRFLVLLRQFMSRLRTIINHLLFWCLFLNIAFIYNAMEQNHGAFTLTNYLSQFSRLYIYVEYGRVIVTFYLSLWVFTHYFYPKHLIIIFLQVVLLGLFDATLCYIVNQKVVGPLTKQLFAPAGTSAINFITSSLTASWLYVMLAFLFKHLHDYYQNEAILHEKNSIELAYLKAQLNPHFLFNSMNNLYGLSLTEPARTPNAILKLAELMRYMLYESNESRVFLSQEIDYLNSYITLEKLRYVDGSFHVSLQVEGEVDGKLIAPLLLIAFVENAFKHGEVGNVAQPIKLHLCVQDGRISFSAQNQVASKNKDLVGGVGLAGIKRRLHLLYPGRHRLSLSDNNGVFYAKLEVEA